MSKRFRILALMLVVIMISGIFAACVDPNIENLASETGSFSGSEEAKSLTDRLTLAWSPKSLRDEYYAEVTRGFEEYCEENKYEALVANPGNKKEEQYSEFENWIAMGVDGIAAAPVDAERLSDVVIGARKFGIASAGFYEQIPSADVNFVIDDFACGVLIGENAARWINEKLDGSANVFLLGMDESEGMLQRRKGIESILADINGVHVVSRKNAATRDEAEKTADTVLAMYPNIDVVICVSDELALGVAEAVQNLDDETVQNLAIETAKFYIGGAGYTSEAIIEMNAEDSYFRSTINFDPYQAGRDIARILADTIVYGAQGSVTYFGMESYWQNLLVW